MKLTEERFKLVTEYCDEKGYELVETKHPELESLCAKLGYDSLGYIVRYESGAVGLLITLSEERDKYNNGVYFLVLDTNGSYLLEVVIANTKDKYELTNYVVNEMISKYEGLNTEDLNVYDLVEIYSELIEKTVIHKLAKRLYPENSGKRKLFMNTYMARFLANVGIYHAGSQVLMEEQVNSEPSILKMILDRDTIGHD